MNLPANDSNKLLSSLRNSNLQDSYLSACISERIVVDIYLQTESSQRGIIEAFDNWVILFRTDKRHYLIYKTAISLLAPVDAAKEVAMPPLVEPEFQNASCQTKVVMTLEEALAHYKVKQVNKSKELTEQQFLALKQTLHKKLQKADQQDEYNAVA